MQPPQRVPLEPVDVTCFGKRAFEDVAEDLLRILDYVSGP